MKPVAWMSPDGKVSTTEGKLFHIPLYTAPREFSDEEILEYTEVFALDYSPLYEFTAQGLILFVRAILKKASEK